MFAALAEPMDAITTTDVGPSNARAEASWVNGKLSRGPTSPEEKDRSRRNGCKDEDRKQGRSLFGGSDTRRAR
jgi:hypothetical protein